ncbi:MAG TPA: NYN domain-containing protein [Longimicrobiaceae bacterium]|nr:NYN domain-containing protein [Longimicrobiaceae bacterium]
MSELPCKLRLEIFVDGTNFRVAQLEAGVRDLDIPRLARQLARGYVLVKMRYYTSPLPGQSGAYRDQHRFFERLRETRAVDLILGRHEPRRESFHCPRCGAISTQRYHVEKETDVNLATDMVIGAYTNRYDVAMLVAGDTDYVHAIEAVQATGRKVIWCHFPSQAHTDRLRQVCDEQVLLDEKFLRTCR